ncbi:MAG: extracellular solute-binding protein, partial [Oscillospiraceae bacterium]
MKTRLKRISTGLLAMTLVIALATSCGESPAKSEKNPNTPEGVTTHKLKLLGPDGTNLDIKFSEREQYPVWQEFQKLFDAKGIELEYEMVASEQYKTVIQTRMAAGNNLPDIATISPLDDTTAITLGQQGIILDVAELTEKYSDGTIRKAIDGNFPFADGLSVTPDGRKYWFSNLHLKTYEGDKPAPVGLATMIRRDWLTKVGASVPTTADEFYKALKSFQDKDANGSGAKDEVVVLSPGVFSTGIAQWFGLGYSVTSVRGDTTEVVSPWYQPGIKDYIKFMKRLVDEGLLDTSGIANAWDVA